MIKKQYIAPLLSLVLTALFIIFLIFMMFDNTLAWFSNNKTADATGMSITALGAPETEQYLIIDGQKVDKNAADLFSSLVPGEKVSFQLYVKNNTDKDIILCLYLASPTENDDTPYIKDGLYHYFGSQIRINSVKKGENEILYLSNNDRYLLTLDNELYIGEGKTLPPTAISSQYDFSSTGEKTLADAIKIDSNGELTLDIELEFVDNGISQNPYAEFGNESASDETKKLLKLSRTLICYFVYDN